MPDIQHTGTSGNRAQFKDLNNGAFAEVMAVAGQNVASAGFSASGASVLDTFFVQTPFVGSGVSFNQASGSINILTGTTINAEFLCRSVAAYRGSMRKRFTLTASQRIANANLAIMLADLLGESLAYTINSATSVTVALPGHTLDATNVGQFVNIAAITGAAAVPGRYAIALLNAYLDPATSLEIRIRTERSTLEYYDKTCAQTTVAVSDRKDSYARFVLPVLAPDLSYADLTIKEGGTASQSWDKLASSEIGQNEKNSIARDLKLYCERDTYAMYAIWKQLNDLI